MSKLFCYMCGGPLSFLGTLGRLDWFRCRYCGSTECQDASDDPADNEPEDDEENANNS